MTDPLGEAEQILPSLKVLTFRVQTFWKEFLPRSYRIHRTREIQSMHHAQSWSCPSANEWISP